MPFELLLIIVRVNECLDLVSLPEMETSGTKMTSVWLLLGFTHSSCQLQPHWNSQVSRWMPEFAVGKTSLFYLFIYFWVPGMLNH